MSLHTLPAVQRRMLETWLPALATGLAAWLAFLIVGETPFIRASGLALVVVGVALALRRWGRILALAGGLALAFSPAFWSQTGGTESLSAPLIIGAALLAALGAALLFRLSRRLSFGLALGLVIFAALFLTLAGSPRSLRLTTLLAAWLLALLVDALMLTNPRPGELPPQHLRWRHTLGMLLILAIGVINDPLFALFVPAIVLGLWLTNTRLSVVYWLALLAALAVGTWELASLYVTSSWWGFPAARAIELDVHVPRMLADGWRESARWLYMFGIVIEQFTPFGLLLGVIGLARLSRWYPPLGVVTLVAYATYFLFGLLYFGRDSAVLLLPLLMIQILWITYAVHSFGHWMQRSVAPGGGLMRWAAPAAFSLLPLFMFLRITGVI